MIVPTCTRNLYLPRLNSSESLTMLVVVRRASYR
jgi:hypothetical protein